MVVCRLDAVSWMEMTNVPSVLCIILQGHQLLKNTSIALTSRHIAVEAKGKCTDKKHAYQSMVLCRHLMMQKMLMEAQFWGRRAEPESWVRRKNAPNTCKLHFCQLPTYEMIDAV